MQKLSDLEPRTLNLERGLWAPDFRIIFHGFNLEAAAWLAALSVGAQTPPATHSAASQVAPIPLDQVGAVAGALAADGTGHLFAGGDFSLAGTKVSPYVAQANIGVGLSAGRFGSLVYSPATGFGCTFSDATISQPYRIQTSLSLVPGSWTDVTNFTYTGPIVISYPSAAGPKKYYRAVSP